VALRTHVPTGCSIVRVMVDTVIELSRPSQFGFGQPAWVPEILLGALSVAGFVVNVRVPFLIEPAGTGVDDEPEAVTWLCPGAEFPPPLKQV
jgi:hypothetical protein